MQGLTKREVTDLQQRFGLNVIEEKQKVSWLRKFLSQFSDFLTILLLVASLLSFFIGETIDGVLIVLIVVLNAFFGLYQEVKAEEAIGTLKKITLAKARVFRDGQEIEIDSRDLVPGDLVFVEEGVKIPADGEVIEEMNLEINESILTGESLPVVKQKKDTVSMGTVVTKGRAKIKILKIGMMTKFGEIASHLSLIDDTQTPLQKKITDLSKLIGYLGIGAAFFVFVLNFIQGASYFNSFLLAISLAVAVVPEGLPAVMTITLSIGVKEMAKRKAVIRKLSAIEALGSVTLIATDKTGTLTTNKMKVKEIFVDDKIYDSNNLPENSNHPFSKMLLNGILCSTASLVYIHDHGSWDVLGDPTEGALLFLSQQANYNYEEIRKEWQIIDEKPFDSVSKKMTVAVEKNKTKYIFTKGAPESILKITDKIQIGEKIHNLTAVKRQEIETVIANWSRKGLRVLAFSYKNPTEKEEIFLGMTAIHDPPRPEVREAIVKTKEAGIKVVMITGDSEKTAEAIGVSTGLVKEGDEIVTGTQLDGYSDEELLKILPKVKIFARTSPFHKHKIVKLFQQLGEVVVVTGDGVNDAIALKQADVGVAMGLVGTDVARETADMVITDDNFASIVNAIEEGRNIIRNLKNAIKYLLSCNISEALSLIVGLIFNIPHLFYAIQLLYINLVTDGFPALALAFSPRESNILKKPPEKQMQLLKKVDKLYIFAIGILSTVIIISSYYLFQAKGLGQTAAFSVLTLTQSFILIDLWLSHHSIRSHYKKLFSPVFILAFSLPFIFQFFILKVGLLANIFRIKTVGIFDFSLFAVSAFLILLSIRFVKKILKINVE